jgi:adenosine deaminase
VHDRGIVLETSPSSNLQTGAIEMIGNSMSDHPIDVLYDLGFKVTINTDNRLMSGTSLTREIELLVDAFGYGLADLEIMQINAAEGAFQAIDDREELIEMISEGFTDADE